MKIELIEDPIISIEDIGNIDTIDIGVSAPDNLFVANNILTHNSGYGADSPGIESTSESMGLAHTADVQICVWADDTDKELGILRLGMQKNRFGVNFGSTSLKIDYETLYLSETEEIFLNNENVSTAKNLLDELQND